MVATAAFIPIEIHELLHKATAFKIATFAVNVAAVVYLLLSKRLFGLRGGREAAERELHSASLLEVEEAVGDAPGEAHPDAPDTEAASGSDVAGAVQPAPTPGAGSESGTQGAGRQTPNPEDVHSSTN